MKSLTVYWNTCLLALAVLLPTTLSATTIVLATDDQLIDKSPVVISGIVLDSQPVERAGGIWTDTTIAVNRVLKGEVGSTVTVREVGGRVGDRMTVVWGSPEYSAGESVLVFLWPRSDGTYQTRDLAVGKFTQRKSRTGNRFWQREELLAGTVLLDGDFKPVQPDPALLRASDAFDDYINARASGSRRSPDYFVRDADVGGTVITADFTLISEPTVYRWTSFDRGTTASWKSYGTQTGYTNGGVNELQTGMSTWTGYSSAKIKYSYSGSTSASPGGLSSPNGTNEVLFNDPLGEIDGSWNGSSGVVGRGGFNNTKSGGSWTSPFEADASHPQKTYSSTWEITEANLVIQDGVSPTKGISSSVLAAIIAHEFGHTLGLGHSSVSTALMYPTVSGGPTLRADDQTAARWLYPSGTTPSPTAPAAPSGLQATASSSTQARLNWVDNASNETSQTVYMALGSGSFSQAATVAADATTATIGSLSAGQTYRFQVKARNSVGESSGSNIAQLTMPAQGVQASFTVSPTSGTAGVTTFVFSDTSSGPVASRSWSFGDGASSTSGSPGHVYAAAGSYTARLTVTSTDGSQSSASRTISVAAPTSGPSAAFSWSPSSPVVNQSVSFSDQSSGAISSWRWSFGDGTSSTQRNPVKTWSAAGSYAVGLTVSDGSSTSTTTRTVNVGAGTPAGPPVAADFSFSPSSPAVNQSVAFTDRSTGSPTSWSWDFGDGQHSTSQNPSHTYAAAGSYTVSLTARNSGSASSTSGRVTVSAVIQKFTALVPASAQTSGAGSSDWHTELTVFNASSFASSVQYVFIPTAGGNPLSRTLSISPNSSMTFENALPELFGLSNGTGAIGIEASSPIGTPDLRLSSRTYSSGGVGTYGQFVPKAAEEMPATMYLTGIDSDAEYRTNVGLVNRSSAAVTANLTLVDPAGTSIAGKSLSLGAKTFQQYPLTQLFPQVAGQSRRGLSLKVVSSSASSVTSYVSVIDNRSQDPVFVPAVGHASNSQVIDAVARLAGGAGTYWRSDVTFYNPTTSTMSLTLRLWISDRDNRGIPGKVAVVPAGATVRIADIMTWLGAGEVKGSIWIVSNTASGPIVTSRTYTTRVSDGATYGQWIPSADITRAATDSLITGLRSDSMFRTNLGFVNISDQPMGVTVTLVSEGGTSASAVISVLPKSQAQPALAALFPRLNTGALGRFTVRAHSNVAGSLMAYGSVIDNLSGDPIFIAGE